MHPICTPQAHVKYETTFDKIILSSEKPSKVLLRGRKKTMQTNVIEFLFKSDT